MLEGREVMMNGSIRKHGQGSEELTTHLGKDSSDQQVPEEAKEAQQ